MTTQLEVRTLPLHHLTPAPYNPRRLPAPADSAYRKLKRSLERFGLVEPLIWNERTGHVVGGHLRLTILKELGHTEVAVSVVDLTDAEEKALNVLLNNPEAQGRFDTARLGELLATLTDLPELDDTGFDASTLRLLQFEPTAAPPPRDENRVEVTLVMDAGRYEEAREELDELVGRYDLESHVRRG